MRDDEYKAYLEQLIPEYAKENVQAGYWDESEALENSKQSVDKLLPERLSTPDHHIYIVEDDGKRVGLIWLRVDLKSAISSGFIFDIQIDEAQRGKGYGKQAMLLLEEKAKEFGLQKIGLHVFAKNDIARRLYEQLGYQITSLNMSKQL